MAWEARKYKDIIDTLTSNLMQLELNIKAIEGYAHILNSKTLDGIIEDTRENLNDIKSDIKDLKGTTEALQNTVKDNTYELSKVLEVNNGKTL